MALSANNSPRFSMEQTSAFIAKSDENFEKQSNQIKPYRFKSTIALNNQLFFIDSLSRFGDTAWIVYKGYDVNAQGNRVGLYATNIQTKTTENKSFDLSKLKGNYVLLDFWGTWCNPCIALIPRLKKLNDTYKVKGFTLVSIAVDKKSDYPKLLKMIADKKMNWEHLYDDYENVISSISKNKYDVDCFPTSVLIDPEGKIIFRGCGDDDFNEVEKLLSSKLK